MFGRKLAPRRLTDDRALGDAKQSIMRLIIVDPGKIGLVTGDERQGPMEGKIDQLRLDLALLGEAMALQFDIKAAAETLLQNIEAALRRLRPPQSETTIERAIRAARQRQQAIGPRRERGDRQMRQIARLGIEPSPRCKMHEIAIARLIFRQQHDSGAPGACLVTAR